LRGVINQIYKIKNFLVRRAAKSPEIFKVRKGENPKDGS